MGPVGMAIGATAGAVVGSMAGNAAAETLDPAIHDAFWEKTYHTRPYASKDHQYPDYQPAYRHGWESAARHPDLPFEHVAPKLESEWDKVRGNSRLEWEKARAAAEDAWNRAKGRL
jgi:hypothetical protein